MTLVERLADSDVASLPDWAAAEALNRPDPSLPVIVEQRWTSVSAQPSGDGAIELIERHQSWAEANGVEVTPRTVGLARGGR